jgi:DNA repair exonuclease SbcCD ATPase subunit
MKVVKYLYVFLLFEANISVSEGQPIPCPEAERLKKEIIELDKRYELEIYELENGIYCDRCNRSKSNIERTTNEKFENHLERVKGKLISAPPEVINSKKKEYKDEKNRKLNELVNSKSKCEAAEAERLRKEKERKENEAKQRAEAAERLRKENEAKQRAEAAERSRRENEAKLKAEEAERLRKENEAKQKAEAEAYLRNLEQKSEQLRLENERLKQDFFNNLNSSLSDFASQRANETKQQIDSWAADLMKYKNKIIGSVKDIYNTSSDAVEPNAKEASKKIFESVDLDGEKEAFDELNSKVSLVKDVWVRNISENIDKLVEISGANKVLKFGQWENIKAIYKSGMDLANDTIGLLDEIRKNGLTPEVEKRANEILKGYLPGLFGNIISNYSK